MTISTRKVYNLVKAGKLPHYRIDNSIRIAEPDLESYIAGCYVAPQPQAPESTAEPAPKARKPLDRQPPVKTSHLKVGPRQLALLRRGGVGISGPDGRSAG
jgi:excisionase family DNA binding protein